MSARQAAAPFGVGVSRDPLRAKIGNWRHARRLHASCASRLEAPRRPYLQRAVLGSSNSPSLSGWAARNWLPKRPLNAFSQRPASACDWAKTQQMRFERACLMVWWTCRIVPAITDKADFTLVFTSQSVMPRL